MEMQQQSLQALRGVPRPVRALGAGARDGRALGPLLRNRAAGRDAVHRPPRRPGERMRRALLVLGALAACAIAGSARADGDPASDYLLGTQVFLPFDLKLPAAKQAGAHVARARREQVRLRDSRRGDRQRLRPRGRHLALAQAASVRAVPRRRDRSSSTSAGCSIVMPNGFGFNWPKHPVDEGVRGALEDPRSARAPTACSTRR